MNDMSQTNAHWDPVQGEVPAHRDATLPDIVVNGRLVKLTYAMCAMPFFLFLVVGPLGQYFNSAILTYATYTTPVFLCLAVWMGTKFIVSPHIIELMLKQRVITRVADSLNASVHLCVTEQVVVDMTGGEIAVDSLVEAAKGAFQNRSFPMPVSPAQIAYVVETERTLSGRKNPRLQVDIHDPFEWELRMAFPIFAGFDGLTAVTMTPYPPNGLMWWMSEGVPRWAAIGLELPSAFNSKYGGWKYLPDKAEASARVLIATRLPRDIGCIGALVLTVPGAVQLLKDGVVPFDVVFDVKVDEAEQVARKFSSKARTICIDLARRFGAEFYIGGETLMIRSTLPIPAFDAQASPDVAAETLRFAIMELTGELDVLAAQLS